MGENLLAINLAKNLENELSDFLNLSWIEKLEKAEDFFKAGNYLNGKDFYKDDRRISLIFKELADFEKQQLEDAGGAEKYFSQFDENNGREELYFNIKNGNLEYYFQMQFERLMANLPYFLLLFHILSNGTYHQISYEHREDLRELCGLKTPNDRQDAFLKLFKFLIREPIKQGGSKGFWNEANSLYFISWYNRFQIVIKNARKELDEHKDTPDVRRKILEKYEIPQEYEDATFSKEDFKISALALDWALGLVGCDVEDAAKALRTAREKAGKYLTNNSKKLISVYKLNLNLVIPSKTLPPEARSKLRFRDFRVNDSTMLYYI